jgi:filamentous hemagglutinin family protein
MEYTLLKTIFKSGDITNFPEDVERHGHDADFEEEHPILCKTCGNKITLIEHMISVGGRHNHTFINPLGITFQIGCFSSAKGCVVTGRPSFEFTWFDGFSWQYALCSYCVSHLGWYYRSPDASFFGLIRGQLKEDVSIH